MQEKFIKNIENNDLIIVMGTMLSRENESIAKVLKEATDKGTKQIFLSVMEDEKLTPTSNMFVRYEAGAEEGVLLILADALVKKEILAQPLKEYFDEIDEGYISAETNVGEEEIEEIAQMFCNAKKPLIVLGNEFFSHPRAKNISTLINVIAKYGNTQILCLGKHQENSNIQVPDEVAELESFDGTNVFTCKPKKSGEESLLIGSRQFAIAAKIQDKEDVYVDVLGREEKRVFVLDSSLKGTIALMPGAYNDSAYQIQRAKITKREVQ